MRLFVTEFITGGGIANDPLPESLKQEGQLMLQAVLQDCTAINNVQLVTTTDARISLDIEDVEIHSVENAIDYMQQLLLIASQCDATWVIAPESEGILETIVSQLTNEKVTLINCNAQSIVCTADKQTCAAELAKHNILTVPSLSLPEVETYSKEVMIKSRYGAGCEGLMRYKNGQLALQNIDNFAQWVIQPYIEGEHLSLSVLYSSQHAQVLTVNEQLFTYENNKPKLKACLVNARIVDHDMQVLAKDISQAIPGLQGYVGIDVIKVDNDYYIVDINPRLTSSYVGLSQVLENNPAELCLNSLLDRGIPQNIKRNNRVVEVSVV